MSLYALHKDSEKMVSAESLLFNPEWMNKINDKWILPDSEISNLQEIKEKKIIPYCSFIKPHERSGVMVRAHFRSINEFVLTKNPENESEEHKLAKDEIYYKIWENEISFDIGGKEYYSKDLGEFEVFIEKGIGSKRADVILILNKYHPVLGSGIVVEVQLSYQSFDTTNIRSYDRALQGYSVVWLNDKHFYKGSLVNSKLKVRPVREVLDIYEKETLEERERQVAIYSSYLNKTIEDFSKQKENIQFKINDMNRQLEGLSNVLSEKIKKNIEEELSLESDKIKKGFKDELQFFSNSLKEIADGNYREASKNISEQNNRLNEIYNKEIENMRIKIKTLTFDRFNEELEKITRELILGDEIKLEVKKVINENLESQKERMFEMAREIVYENIKDIQEKNIEEAIQKKVDHHITYRSNLFDKAMWDAMDRKLDSVINKENLGELWQKKK